MSAPRILALMGSGETAPTMVTTHREIVARLGPPAPRAVLLDTPYGFQENAPELSQRTVEHFRHRVQLAVEVVGFPGPLAVEPADRTTQPIPGALARLRAAAFVFAGPGSPSYALAAWRPSPVPAALADKLAHGGAVVFSSAAAVTAGRFSLPVYEIYKAGHPLAWLDGLDLLAAAGLPPDGVAVPHFDNAEGGTHDTRYCYMGERRLAELEALLPESAWILGIDEHTALVLDLSAQTASVTGRGAVTVRRRGSAQRFEAGTRLPIAELGATVRRAGTPTRGAPAPPDVPPGAIEHAVPAGSPLLAEVARLEALFAAAIATGAAGEATGAILALDRAIVEWSADSLQSDEPDRARAVLHALVHRLGEAAAAGLRDPRERMAPLVEALIALRTDLRADRAWALADRLRDRLTAAGIELRDTPTGSVWSLRPRDEPGPGRGRVEPMERDRGVTLADTTLAEIVRRLVEGFRPERIYLFGSRARGDAGPDSDYDLLMVLDRLDEPAYWLSQRAHDLLWGLGVAADILVWSRQAFDSRLGLKASLPSTVVREGTLLHGR